MQPEISPAGDRGLFIELGEVSTAALHASAAAVRAIPGALTCIAGQQSLYAVFDREPDSTAVQEVLAHAGEIAMERRTHAIEVSFAPVDAPDLPEFLSKAKLTREEFLDRVRRLQLSARYLGFRAGFAYLDGWPEAWRMARRPTSRLRVPRGSFAIAGPSAGFYPIDSPGGWNILGRTAAPLWDAARTPPNMISAGDEISIVPVQALGPLPDVQEAFPQPRVEGMEIVANAQLATSVGPPDWKRVDYGLPPGGPFDAAAAVLANRAAGNGDDAPLLECAMVVPRVRTKQDGFVAWCGAESDLPQLEPLEVRAGQQLGGGRIRGGLRGWLALGHAPSAAVVSRRVEDDRFTIRCVAGPHKTPLREISCEVTPQLNRVGIRMRPLDRIAFEVSADLPSCGMQFGTIQLHPDGTVVAMGPDHPITGGYLEPLTVRWGERWKLAQLAPGDRVRFVS